MHDNEAVTNIIYSTAQIRRIFLEPPTDGGYCSDDISTLILSSLPAYDSTRDITLIRDKNGWMN